MFIWGKGHGQEQLHIAAVTNSSVTSPGEGLSPPRVPVTWELFSPHGPHSGSREGGAAPARDIVSHCDKEKKSPAGSGFSDSSMRVSFQPHLFCKTKSRGQHKHEGTQGGRAGTPGVATGTGAGFGDRLTWT